ncbi:transcriptional regulator, AraC family [Streptomyces sp. TLI_053]|nr:transcriptional regulator, AraC family [Streptomyces sp. TLI_053]
MVLHAGKSNSLRWSADGAARRERFYYGQSLVNPAGWASRPRWEADAELMLVALEPAWLEKLAAESDLPGPLEIIPRFHLNDPFLAMLVERLVSEYEQSHPADLLYAQSLVQALAAHVIRTAGSQHRAPPSYGGALPPRRLARVIDHMNAFLSSRLTLDDLAAVAGLSPSHFARSFRAATGWAPHQYLIRLRLERAREALLNTDLPAALVAQQCGFADQSHLTRTMQTHTGQSPRALRVQRDARPAGYGRQYGQQEEGIRDWAG